MHGMKSANSFSLLAVQRTGSNQYIFIIVMYMYVYLPNSNLFCRIYNQQPVLIHISIQRSQMNFAIIQGNKFDGLPIAISITGKLHCSCNMGQLI